METISRDNAGLGEMEKKQPKGDLEGESVELQRARSVRNHGCFLGQRGIHGRAGKGEKVT